MSNVEGLQTKSKSGIVWNFGNVCIYGDIIWPNTFN